MLDIREHKDVITMILALGDAYLDKGLYAEAIKKYQQLLMFKFENRHVMTNLSKAYLSLKKVDREALAVYQKAVQYHADNKEIYDTLARAFLTQRRDDQTALKIYNLALRHETAIAGQLLKHLVAVFFKQKIFAQCKELTESFIFKADLDPRTLILYLRSCWHIGAYDDAIKNLKKLWDLSSSDHLLVKYLCMTYLEKIYDAEDHEKSVQLSFIDRELVSEYLQTCGSFESLQDLALYLEVKQCYLERKYWRHLNQTALPKEKAYLYQPVPVEDNLANVGELPTDTGALNIQSDVFERLSALISSKGKDTPAAPPLTFEDFKQAGSEIFSRDAAEAAPHSSGLGKTLITIELSKFNALYQNFGEAHALEVRNRLFAKLKELFVKYRMTQAWGTSNGLVLSTEATTAAVAFAIELLNKLNRYNFVNDAASEIRLAIGIHAVPAARSEHGPSLSDLCLGVSLGIASDRQLNQAERSDSGRAFRKTDRILISREAYTQLQRDNRFKVNQLGKFKFKHSKSPIPVYEVVWRNPIDDLRFGFIKKLGRFDLLSELGNKGAMRVFKAKDSGLQRFVILKVIQSEAFNSLPLNNQRKVQFYSHAKLQAQMSHPNITNIYEVDEDQGLTYIAREYAEGVPINQIFGNGSPFEPDRLVKLLFQVSKSLQYSHRKNFVHGNLKPSNILVGHLDEIKISDFAIPSILFIEQEEGAQPQHYVYRAPEQILGRSADVRSDMFSLGVVFYELMTQVHPFACRTVEETKNAVLHKRPNPPSEWNPDLPKFCEALILKCMAKNPDERFQSIDEVVAVMKDTFESTLFSNFSFQIAQSRDS